MIIQTSINFTIQKEEWETFQKTVNYLKDIVGLLGMHRSSMTGTQKNFLDDAGDALLAMDNLFDYYDDFGE